MKIKSESQEIDLIDLLETMGCHTLSPSMKFMFEKQKIEYPANNYAEMAKLLGSTPYRVKKAIKIYLAQTDDEKAKLRRRPGRPDEPMENQLDAIRYLSDQRTLDKTKTYSKPERIEQFNQNAEHKVKLHTLNKIYKSLNIRKKYQRVRLGRPKLEIAEVQREQIRQLRRKVNDFKNQGYDILLCDECIFSPNSYQRGRYWSHPNRQLIVAKKFENQKPIACCAFLSKTKGVVQYQNEIMSFDSNKFIRELLKLRKLYGEKKIAIYLDNCSIHKSKQTTQFAASLKPPIPLIYNLPYRPDLNNIELLWAQVKLQYRKLVANLKMSPVPWDNMAVVEHLMSNQDLEAKRFWKLYRSLNQAQPIQKAEWEPRDPAPYAGMVEQIVNEEEIDERFNVEIL